MPTLPHKLPRNHHVRDAAQKPFFSCLIDTVALAVRVRHEPIEKYAQGNANIKRAGAYVYKVSSLLSDKIIARVLSRDDRETLYIEVSMAKFLTHQNFVGREDLHEPAVATILLVLEQMGIAPTKSELAAIRAGKYRVRRIDYALHCDCGSAESASAVMAAIRLLMCARADNPSAYKNECVYANQHSARWTLRIYRKDIEVNLRSRAMPEHVYARAYLLEKVVGCVRLEQVLRSRELKRLGLDDPLSWSPSEARARMQVWIDRLSCVAGKIPTVAGIDSLRSSVQLKLRAWLLGDVTAFTRSPSTAAACRREVLRITGIDIRGLPSVQCQRRCVITVRNVFRNGVGFKSYAHKWPLLVKAASTARPQGVAKSLIRR